MLVVEQPNIITTFSKNKTFFLYNKIAYREDVFNFVNFKFKLATHGDPVARYHQPSNFSNRVGP